jgi:hypothetical protein
MKGERTGVYNDIATGVSHTSHHVFAFSVAFVSAYTI